MANLLSGAAKPITNYINANRRARGILAKAYQLYTAINNKIEPMTPTQKNNAVNTAATRIASWDLTDTATPTGARENTLFIMIVILYMVVGVILMERLGE